jgi:hypothetical protein
MYGVSFSCRESFFLLVLDTTTKFSVLLEKFFMPVLSGAELFSNSHRLKIDSIKLDPPGFSNRFSHGDYALRDRISWCGGVVYIINTWCFWYYRLVQHVDNTFWSLQVLPAVVILRLAFQSLGVVYGDLGTSPLYVFRSTFPQGITNKRDVVGALSLIIYTISLIPLFKYMFIVLRANDNGEGKFSTYCPLMCLGDCVHVASFSLVGDLGNRSCLPDVWELSW